MRILYATATALAICLVAGCGDSCGGEIAKLPVPGDGGLVLREFPEPPPPPPPKPSPSPRAPEAVDGVLPPLRPPAGDTMTIPLAKLSALRVTGQTQIAPDEDDAAAIREAKISVVATFKLCLDEHGRISALNALKSSGYPGYDAKLEATIKTTWRFRPHEDNGKPVPACSAVTFIYR